eukprot:scaffold10533_cov101-Isochrysis_galbana.AAC.3
MPGRCRGCRCLEARPRDEHLLLGSDHALLQTGHVPPQPCDGRVAGCQLPPQCCQLLVPARHLSLQLANSLKIVLDAFRRHALSVRLERWQSRGHPRPCGRTHSHQHHHLVGD